MVADARASGAKLSRTKMQTFRLYTQRCFLFIIYIIVQAAASSGLFFVTAYSLSIQKAFSSAATAANTNVSYLPLVIYSLINAIMPVFLSYLTLFEKWDSGEYQINILLVRMYFNNIVGASILALSYYLLANPYLFAMYPQFRDYFSLNFSNKYHCHIDQAANNLFTLVLVAFAFQIVADVTTPFFYYLYAICMRIKYAKPEFDVASNMISIFGLFTLIFLSYPFAPLSLLFTPIYFFIWFWTQYFCVTRFYSKPVKPWKAQKAATVFTSLYLVTFLLICVPTSIFFLLSSTFPKSCDIQDDTVGLCKSMVYPQNNTCITDPSSLFYPLYGHSNYPANICANSCGPFVQTRSNLDPLKNYFFYNAETIQTIYGLIIFPYLAWVLVFVFLIGLALQLNTIKVQNKATEAKSRETQSLIQDLEIKKELLEKKLTRMQAMESIHNETDIQKQFYQDNDIYDYEDHILDEESKSEVPSNSMFYNINTSNNNNTNGQYKKTQ